MNRILATARSEFRISLRNRWVAIAVVLAEQRQRVLRGADQA